MTPTLYDLESDLVAMLDTLEGGIPENLEAEFHEELAAKLAATVEKRDSVSRFFRHLESQIQNCASEIDRIEKLAGTYKRAHTWLSNHVRDVIMSLGKDEHGRYRKLEGSTSRLSVRKLPPKVDEDIDFQQLPAKFVDLTFTVPASAWDDLIASLTPEQQKFLRVLTEPKLHARKADIAAALKNNEEVPGARLIGTAGTERYKLEVE